MEQRTLVCTADRVLANGIAQKKFMIVVHCTGQETEKSSEAKPLLSDLDVSDGKASIFAPQCSTRRGKRSGHAGTPDHNLRSLRRTEYQDYFQK